jgi:tRNA pseudouridine55 synthase
VTRARTDVPSTTCSGALIVDKPSGPTSHDVVARVRRALHTSRVGHTGTLDPLATGLLVLLLGPATRLAQFLVADDKEYIAEVRLGIETETYDAASLPHDYRAPLEGVAAAPADEIERVLEEFRGTYLQTPPAYSAKKVAGTRAYKHARRQDPVELQPVEVTVRHLDVISSSAHSFHLHVTCSAGFYVRSLAHDIGRRLGCGAHLGSLRRIRSGQFSIDDAQSLDAIELPREAAAVHIVPAEALLPELPEVILSEEGTKRASHGNWLRPQHFRVGASAGAPGMRVKLLDANGRLVGIATQDADGLLHPAVVLV